MREKLEQRLQELKAEYESGQKMLADLEARQEELRNTLMRISGAITILEEVLAPEDKPSADCTPGVQPENGQEAASCIPSETVL